MSQSFGRHVRLRHRAEFLAVQERGRRISGRHMTLLVLPNTHGVDRLGVVASRKLGGAVVRNQLSVRFDGEGTSVDIRGATLLKGRQHADTTLVADHAKGHCTSRELFKTVLDGESHGVFQGKIVVRENAQKTDGKMMTRALLLSETAEADNKPELEIFADDVVCGHGATAGALDADLLFYLKARGIPEQEAQALLIQAFVGEAIEGIAHEGVREALMDASRAWLATRG